MIWWSQCRAGSGNATGRTIPPWRSENGLKERGLPFARLIYYLMGRMQGDRDCYLKGPSGRTSGSESLPRTCKIMIRNAGGDPAKECETSSERRSRIYTPE